MALVANAGPLHWNRASALASAAVTSVLGLITVWYLRRQCTLLLPVKRRCTDKEVLAEAEEVRRRYCLSEDGGFLPNDCLDRLPAEFDAWEAIASDLPRLNASKALAARVEALPVLKLGHHRSKEVLQRAYVLLGSLVHSYVHRHEVPWHCLEAGAVAETDGRSSCRKVPKALAEPWLEVCQLLRAPPVLTAAATDLWNWRKKDAALGFDPGNLEQRISLTGTSSERVFHMVPCAMQAAASEVVPKIFLADRLIVGKRQEELALLLLEVADVLGSFKNIFAQIPKGVDPDVFYDIYRPLLNGFHPSGVIMEVHPVARSGEQLRAAWPNVMAELCRLKVLEVKSYGVLGRSNKEKKADPPDEATVLVDPAGLHHIRGGPFGAAGAAGANYQWLEISEAEAFPEDVQEAITTECQAKYHAYADGKKKCIHVVGPDFRDSFDDPDCTIENAVKKLALAYGNVFEEFCADKSLKKMRLLPISGGIFSGPFKDDLPEITAKAAQAAYDALTAEKKEHIMQSSIEMCIFMEPEFKLFASAFGQSLPPAAPEAVAAELKD